MTKDEPAGFYCCLYIDLISRKKWLKKLFNNFICSIIKGANIKYVGGGRGFYKFFKKKFVAQETVDLNIS